MGKLTTDRSGFTLLELVIAGAIVTIMLTIASSNLRLWLNHSSAVGFQRELLSRCVEARTRAMASNLQHRLRFDLDGETVALQTGNRGTGSNAWSNVGPVISGSRGAGINNIVLDNGTTVSSSTFSLIYNPGGQVLAQDNASTILPMTSTAVRLVADNLTDRATIRIYGFTSKARLENGWN